MPAVSAVSLPPSIDKFGQLTTKGWPGAARGCNRADIVHKQASCNSTTRISLDKAAAAVEEKFRTTTAAPMPTLAECVRMTRAKAATLAGKICRVPFTFVVAPTTGTRPIS